MIDMDVVTRIDEASLRSSSQDIQSAFERVGREVGDTVTRRIEDDFSTAGTRSGQGFATGFERTTADIDAHMRDTASSAEQHFTRAGEDSGSAFTRAMQSAMQGLSTGLQGAAQGEGFAGDFASGFSGSAALARIGSAAGPIGLALAGLTAVGFATGSALVSQIEAGMSSMATRDMFQARLGVDDGTMARLGGAAGDAYVNAWGESVADNLRAGQFGIQGGLIDTNATQAEIERTMGQMQALSGAMEADIQDVAHAGGQLIRGGLADSATEAMDILAAGAQRGLNITGDWLDTIGEYTTQFRKIGLDGADAIGLIQQGLEGAARDSDVVADALKEFSIRAVDGSKTTKEGFEGLGFDAEDMGRRFAQGGDTARAAFGAVLQALRSVDDPMQQALIWQRLFGTQWEDMGDAANRFDLSKARSEIGDTRGTIDGMTETLSAHTNQWDVLGRNIDTTFGKLQEWLANTKLGQFLGQTLPSLLNMPFQPDVPHPDSTGLTPNSVDAQGRPIPRDATPPPGSSWSDLMLPPSPGSPSTPPPSGLPGPLGLLPPPGSPPPPGSAAAAPTPGAPTPIPTDPDAASATKPKPNFDPSQWSLDAIPLGSFPGEEGISGLSTPGSPSAPTSPYTTAAGRAGTGPGYFEVDSQRVFDAETSVQSAKDRLQMDRFRYLSVQADQDATEAERYQARAALVQDGRAVQSALAKLEEAQQGTWKKMEDTAKNFSNGMGQIGAALDNDFGMSKGLAGLAENFTKFLANIAAAPVLGQLGAISEVAGDEGHGMLGIAAASGMFGPRFMQGGGGFTGDTTSSSSYSTAGTGAPLPAGSARTAAPRAGAALPGESARDFAHRVMMPFWESQGLTVGDHAADQYGEHQNGALDIMVPSIAEGQKVLQQVLADPNVYGAIFNNQTYGYGHGLTPRDYSAGHTGNPTQDHQDHVHAWYKPGDPNDITPGNMPPGSPGTPAPGGYAQMPAAPYGSVTITAQSVTVMGGGGGGGAAGLPGADGAPLGSPASGMGNGPAPGPASGGLSVDQWGNIVGAEASGNWAANTGNGFFGGPQFTQSTWDAYKLPGMPGRADLATPEQQMEVGDRVLASQGPGAWPATSAAHPDWFRPATPGSPLGTPASGVGAGPLPGPGGAGAGTGTGGRFPGMAGPPQAPTNAYSAPTSRGANQQSPGGEGFAGVSGLPLAAATAAAGMLPGGGAAAQTAMQLINRTIGYAGQAVGIGVGGLLETFLPNNSPLADPSRSWLGRIAAGFAGAAPALPNMAGQAAPPQQQQQGGAPGQQQPGGPDALVKIEHMHNHGPDGQGVANDIARNQLASAAAGMRP